MHRDNSADRPPAGAARRGSIATRQWIHQVCWIHKASKRAKYFLRPDIVGKTNEWLNGALHVTGGHVGYA